MYTIQNANIWNSYTKSFDPDSCITIDGDKIVSVPTENVESSDLSGCYIIPGLIDMHVHLTFKQMYGAVGGKNGLFDGVSETALTIRAVRVAQKLLSCGITTALEAGCSTDIAYCIKNSINNNIIPGPRMVVCGRSICLSSRNCATRHYPVDTVDDVLRAVREQLRNGADNIKLLTSKEPVFLSSKEPVISEMPQEIIQAAADEAHKYGKRLHVHAFGRDQIEKCISGGADVIHHGAYLTEDLAEQMYNSGISLVPTLSSYRLTAHPMYGRGQANSDSHKKMWQGFDSMFENAVNKGVNIAVGTDSVGSYIHELQMMNRRGVSSADCIQAATINGAKALGLDAVIGSLETGKYADMVVLNTDPLSDPANLRDIRYIIKNGLIYTPEHLTLENMSSTLLNEAVGLEEDWM